MSWAYDAPGNQIPNDAQVSRSADQIADWYLRDTGNTLPNGWQTESPDRYNQINIYPFRQEFLGDQTPPAQVTNVEKVYQFIDPGDETQGEEFVEKITYGAADLDTQKEAGQLQVETWVARYTDQPFVYNTDYYDFFTIQREQFKWMETNPQETSFLVYTGGANNWSQVLRTLPTADLQIMFTGMADRFTLVVNTRTQAYLDIARAADKAEIDAIIAALPPIDSGPYDPETGAGV